MGGEQEEAGPEEPSDGTSTPVPPPTGPSLLPVPELEKVVITSADNEKYSCSIPQVGSELGTELKILFG